MNFGDAKWARGLVDTAYKKSIIRAIRRTKREIKLVAEDSKTSTCIYYESDKLVMAVYIRLAPRLIMNGYTVKLIPSNDFKSLRGIKISWANEVDSYQIEENMQKYYKEIKKYADDSD